MQIANIPLKFYVPFAQNDSSRVEIPVTTTDTTRASQSLGFPPLTMQPPESGGVPPQGEDFNGAINQVARIAWWLMAGGPFVYDATFASNSNINGYPQGARVTSSDYLGAWLCLADNNQNNPDTLGTNWVPGYSYGQTTLALTNSNVTLTPLQASKRILIFTGTLTGNVVITLPAWVYDWKVVNNTTGAFTLTLTTAGGSGFVLAQGGSARARGDGVNINSDAQQVGAATASTHAMQLGQAVGRLIQVQIFNSSGTYNPTPGTNSIIVEAQAGGGGGGGVAATGASQFSIGGGGQSGAYAKSRFTSGFSGGISVTIGAAGTAGAAGNNQGGTGGNTSFGSLLAVGGGIGGLGGAATAYGTVLFQQTPGAQSVLTPSGNIITKGQSVISFGWGDGQGAFVATSGNDSPLGTGGRGAVGATAAGGGAIGNGAGGGGAGAGFSAAAQAGGAGGGGCIIVWEYA